MTLESENPEMLYTLDDFMQEEGLPPVFPSSQSSIVSEGPGCSQPRLISDICDREITSPFISKADDLDSIEAQTQLLDRSSCTSPSNYFTDSSLAYSPLSIPPRSPNKEDSSLFNLISPNSCSSNCSASSSFDELEDADGDDEFSGDISDLKISDEAWRELLEDISECTDGGFKQEEFDQMDYQNIDHLLNPVEISTPIASPQCSPHSPISTSSPNSDYFVSSPAMIYSHQSSLNYSPSTSPQIAELTPMDASTYALTDIKPAINNIPQILITHSPASTITNSFILQSHADETKSAVITLSEDQSLFLTASSPPSTLMQNMQLKSEYSDSSSNDTLASSSSTRKRTISSSSESTERKKPATRGRKRKSTGSSEGFSNEKKKDQNKEAARRYREKKKQEDKYFETEEAKEIEINSKLKKDVEQLRQKFDIYINLCKELLQKKRVKKP